MFMDLQKLCPILMWNENRVRRSHWGPSKFSFEAVNDACVTQNSHELPHLLFRIEEKEQSMGNFKYNSETINRRSVWATPQKKQPYCISVIHRICAFLIWQLVYLGFVQETHAIPVLRQIFKEIMKILWRPLFSFLEAQKYNWFKSD